MEDSSSLMVESGPKVILGTVGKEPLACAYLRMMRGYGQVLRMSTRCMFSARFRMLFSMLMGMLLVWVTRSKSPSSASSLYSSAHNCCPSSPSMGDCLSSSSGF